MTKNEYQQKKSECLGMAISTARSILHKNLMFELVKQCSRNTCHRCAKTIESPDELSIDHVEDWLLKENAKELYFDLNNIRFSHLGCNSGAKRCKLQASGKCGFKGVAFDPSRKSPKKYRAALHTINGNFNLGWFLTPEEAAIKYDEIAKERLGERAVTNAMLKLV